MSVAASELRAVPIFRDIPEARLTELVGIFERKTHPDGKTLFETGAVPNDFLVLVRGTVALHEGERVKYTLRAVAPIGELGSLTGLPRSVTAVTSGEAEVWSVPVARLMSFFDEHGDVAFPFYRALLGVVSDKVHRDRRRVEEMRFNIIKTQKQMKQLRELVLAAPETEISAPIFEALDGLIENNRRAHYRVSPTVQYPAEVRFDDGRKVRVVEMSDGFLKVDLPAANHAKGSEVSAVLALPMGDIPLSGTVERAGTDGVVVKLDLLIDEYKSMIEDYVTKVQLLDFVI
jgi:CRP/FNR family cyclic AMP-dependent transcriptional regulator